MARISVTMFGVTDDVAVTGTASIVNIDALSGHEINYSGASDGAVIIIRNTAGTAKTVTVKAGNLSFAEQGQGDLTASVAAGGRCLISPSVARFGRSSSTGVNPIQLDFEAGFTGTIEAIRVARHPSGTQTLAG